MRKVIVIVALAALALSIGAAAYQQASHTGHGQEAHRISLPDKIQWGPGPASLPPGAQAAVLEGDPTKPGSFTLRLKVPDGYQIKPHSHPVRERVTVLAGAFVVGMGDKWDDSKMTPLPAGTFIFIEPNHTHFAKAQGETIVQVNGEGPWKLNYVNPADDPRQPKN